MKKRKKYTKPAVARVTIRPAEAVLACYNPFPNPDNCTGDGSHWPPTNY